MPVEKYNIHVHEIEHAHYPAHNCVGVYSTCMRHNVIKTDRSTLHDSGGHWRLEAVSLQSRPAPLASSTAPTDERYSSPADVSSPKPSNADTQATGRDGRNLQTQSTVHKCWETFTHTHTHAIQQCTQQATNTIFAEDSRQTRCLRILSLEFHYLAKDSSFGAPVFTQSDGGAIE